MFYEPGKTPHGLKYSPYKACVVPRPVGWISTLSADGVHNLAPFSQFQSLTFDPPYVMFSSNQTTEGKRKDTCVNVEETGEFVWNMATYALREAVNISAEQFPPEVDEFARAGLSKTPAESRQARDGCGISGPLRVPLLPDDPFAGNGTIGTVDVIIGSVIGVHISDDVITPEGRVDILKIRPIAKMGYYDYTSVDSLFEMVIPSKNELLKAGMEGRAST